MLASDKTVVCGTRSMLAEKGWSCFSTHAGREMGSQALGIV
jgi:hypothetical protein